MGVRKSYRRKNGVYVRGTWIKPRYFKKKLVVDLDFHTLTKRQPDGTLSGRSGIKKRGERVPVIRTKNNGGLIIGRTKKFTSPFPKSYLIMTRIKNRTRRRRIPVTRL